METISMITENKTSFIEMCIERGRYQLGILEELGIFPQTFARFLIIFRQ